MKATRLLIAALSLLASTGLVAPAHAYFDCDAVCTCDSRCSTQCWIGDVLTDCRGFGTCVDFCYSASEEETTKLATLEEELFGASPAICEP